MEMNEKYIKIINKVQRFNRKENLIKIRSLLSAFIKRSGFFGMKEEFFTITRDHIKILRLENMSTHYIY